MAKNKSQEQKQLVEAIGYFKALKENAPNTNPKIIEELDKAEMNTQDALFKLLKSTIKRSTAKLIGFIIIFMKGGLKIWIH